MTKLKVRDRMTHLVVTASEKNPVQQVAERVLVVTEDPFFVEEVKSRLGLGCSVSACLGPAQKLCLMESRGSCSLAEHADVALVDSPVTGTFYDHYHGIPSISYAERLAEKHPKTPVILCNSVEKSDGAPSAFLSRHEALNLIRELLQRRADGLRGGEADEESMS